ALLKLYLCQYVKRATLVCQGQHFSLCDGYFTPFAPQADSCLQSPAPQEHWQLQLVSEVLLVPQVHHFVQFNLLENSLTMLLQKADNFTLQLEFDRPLATDLELSSEQFQLNCVPAVNLVSSQCQLPALSGGERTLTVEE